MPALTYPLNPASPHNYQQDSELGPIQMVSGGRMLRTLTIDGRYFGGIYANIDSDKPLSDRIHRVPGRDYVSLQIVPYETCHRNPEFRSRGEAGFVEVPRYGAYGEVSDFEVWNSASHALFNASLALTSRYNRLEPVQFERGRWKCSYVGTDGVDTVWHQCRKLSAGLLRVRTGARPHFLAIDTNGAHYRLCVGWEREPHPSGDVVLRVAAIHTSGPTAAIPEYLKRWVLSRCNGAF